MIMSTATEFDVDILQFLFPDGRRKWVVTQLPIFVQHLYEEMCDNDYRFEMEILTTGEVSITISNAEGDLDIRVVPNGPEVQEAMVEMLKYQGNRHEKIICGN